MKILSGETDFDKTICVTMVIIAQFVYDCVQLKRQFARDGWKVDHQMTQCGWDSLTENIFRIPVEPLLQPMAR